MFSVIDVHEAADEKIYVEDVFSAFTYDGSNSAQTLETGINLLEKGGLFWTHPRSATGHHYLVDTERGDDFVLSTNLTNAQQSGYSSYFDFLTNGVRFPIGNSDFTVGGRTHVSWTFRKAKKFFDVKTYTGNSVAGRQITHDLGVAPGMIVVKRTNSSGSWQVYHRGIASTNSLVLNTTAAIASAATVWNSTDPTDAVFTLGSSTDVNAGGSQYVAYIFAHDDSADGIIQCGTFSSNASVNLGWEPQYVLIKRVDGAQDWFIFDTSRGYDLSSSDTWLAANLSQAEATTDYGNPTSSGFQPANLNTTYVYLAIRKGLMRPPTDASKVFNIMARTGTGSAATITTQGIKTGVDLLIAKQRSATREHMWSDRLRGTASQLTSDSTAAETTVSNGVTSYNMNVVSVGPLNTVNAPSGTYINYLIKQARGFFDIVGYTGTGAVRTVPHNLGAVPELMIFKNRSDVIDWDVYYGDPLRDLRLNQALAAALSANSWGNTAPDASGFRIGVDSKVNGSGKNIIAYLFASCPGVSKIGTYTGTGATQNIDCGFVGSARFVMIKRIDSTGDWSYWDSTRGIISGNDPYLLFNSTAAEVTSTNYLAPLSSGFTVTGSDSDVNASGGTYLYFSVA